MCQYHFSLTVLCTILIAGGSDIPREVVRVSTETIAFFFYNNKRSQRINMEVSSLGIGGLEHNITNACSFYLFPQEIQVCVVKLVIQCQQSSFNSFPIPFSNAECRQGLYHVLLCCLLSNSPYVPSPVNHAVKLFSSGLQDIDLKVV